MKLTLTEIKRRAQRIALLLTDNDGVLTDTGVYYSDTGEVMKRFSIRDGMGVERLRTVGIDSGIITGEKSGSVKTRAEKLKITQLHLGIKNKRECLDAILAETGLAMDQIAYIGDDYNDFDIIETLNPFGITACPYDAVERISQMVHYRCAMKGGNGAFRDFAEFLISMRS
jgi:3-deoxy-D-manno-octulosonate 8-phosphate phosphatase (KDO 8-P phosphatase)